VSVDAGLIYHRALQPFNIVGPVGVKIMSQEQPRLSREKRTVEVMVRIACRGRHGTQGEICEECEKLLSYALDRLAKCPFQASKPTCAECSIHCYRPDMRGKIQSVMRYAGPRMLFRHPCLAIAHLVDGLQRKPGSVRVKESGTPDAKS
jgi:hypothetical protein